MASPISHSRKRTVIDLASDDESDQDDRSPPKRRMTRTSSSTDTSIAAEREPSFSGDENQRFQQSLHDFTCISGDDSGDSDDSNDSGSSGDSGDSDDSNDSGNNGDSDGSHRITEQENFVAVSIASNEAMSSAGNSDSEFQGFSPGPADDRQQNTPRICVQTPPQTRSQSPASESEDFHDAMESQQQAPIHTSPALSSSATLGSCPSDSEPDIPESDLNEPLDGRKLLSFGPAEGGEPEPSKTDDEDTPTVADAAIDNPSQILDKKSRLIDATNTKTTMIGTQDDLLASTTASQQASITALQPFSVTAPQPPGIAAAEPARLSPAFRQHELLQRRVLKLINEIPWTFKAGFEWPARRYWIAVIPASKAASERMMPSPDGTMVPRKVLSFSIKDVIWLQGNKYTTLRTIGNTFYSRTLLGNGLEDQKQEEFFLLGGVEKITDPATNCQAMDIMGDKVVVLIACDKQARSRVGQFEDRQLLEGLIPAQQQVIDLT